VIATKFKVLHGWADCVDGFIRVVKQTNKMHIVPVGGIVGLANLVRENAASGGIESIWLVNIHVDSDTYWTLYYLDWTAWFRCVAVRYFIELYYSI
jgi:hypothetical protein